MIIQVIQLSDRMLTCARFRRKGDFLTPLSGVSLDFGELSELPRILAEQLPPVSEELRTILSIPTGMLSLRELNLPLMDRKKIREVLPIELSTDCGDQPAELACDAIPLATGGQLAGWVPQVKIKELIELVAAAGMEPEVVTCHPLTWQMLDLPGSKPVMLLDSNALALVDQGHLLFCRIMPTDDKDELNRTVAALELGKSVRPAACYRLDSALLENEKPAPVPEELASMPATGDMPPASLLSCLAVARAYINGDIFNLRNNSLAWNGDGSHLLKQFRTPLVLGILLFVLLFAEAGIRWYLLKRDISAVDSSISSIYKAVFPNRAKPLDEAGEMKSEIKRLQGGATGSEMLQFLNLLAKSKDSRINGLSEVEYYNGRFSLKGDAASTGAVADFARKLTTSGFVVDQPELSSRHDGTTLFLIKGRPGGNRP